MAACVCRTSVSAAELAGWGLGGGTVGLRVVQIASEDIGLVCCMKGKSQSWKKDHTAGGELMKDFASASAWKFFFSTSTSSMSCVRLALMKVARKRRLWEVSKADGMLGMSAVFMSQHFAQYSQDVYFVSCSWFLRSGIFPPEQNSFNVSSRISWSRRTSSKTRNTQCWYRCPCCWNSLSTCSTLTRSCLYKQLL